jgi:transitional endoplasmic reticulum ATPase
MARRRRTHRILKKTILIDEGPYNLIRAIWMLRTLVKTDAIDEFIDHRQFEEKTVMSSMGLEPLKTDRTNETRFDPSILDQQLNKLENLSKTLVGNKSVLTINVENLGERIGLSTIEKELLSFFLIIANEKILSDFIDVLGNVSSSGMFKLISIIMNIEPSAVQKALSRKSSLQSSGLVKITNSITFFSNKFEVLEGLDDSILCEKTSTEEFLRDYFKELAPTPLRLSDFPHFERDIELLTALLSQAQKTSEPGINIMFYGLPGTGKTELAKAILEKVSNKIYSINVENLDGEAISPGRRLDSYQLCQRLLRKNECTVIFDEIEDIFVDSGYTPFFGNKPKSDKAWINNVLEQNPVPTIWICNSVEFFEEAFLRRFSYSLKFETPPRNVREQIIKCHMKGIKVPKEFLQNLAKNNQLTPSQISTAAKNASLIGNSVSLSTQEVIEMTLEKSSCLKGIDRKSHAKTETRLAYSLEYLNADADLSQLKDGLMSNPVARILLHGPPGTGKTQYVRHLAESMDLPLIEVGGSDLLDPYIGGTEQKIMDVFKKAAREECVLLIDEADSLFWSRKSATRSWEASAVNELLRQTQEFGGILFASSNMLSRFDNASIRRFDLKIKFDYMTNDQVIQMTKKLINVYGGRVRRKKIDVLTLRISKLKNLTPGDFALLARQFRFKKENISLETVIEKLEQESLIKGGNKRVIGF